MLYEPNLWRHTPCSFCGNWFMDDCGWDFCSSDCEEAYGEYHKECETCHREQEEDTFPDGCHCENCLEEELENEVVSINV